MNLYALVASDCRHAVDLFVTRDLAEQALAEALADEPAFAALLSIDVIDEPAMEALASSSYGSSSSS